MAWKSSEFEWKPENCNSPVYSDVMLSLQMNWESIRNLQSPECDVHYFEIMQPRNYLELSKCVGVYTYLEDSLQSGNPVAYVWGLQVHSVPINRAQVCRHRCTNPGPAKVGITVNSYKRLIRKIM